MRALISVYDKGGVVEFARALSELGVEIVSTGGTARLLREHAVPLREVHEVTGFPEMLGGRVKTLHPAIHAGILYRRDDPQHCRELDRQSFAPIDLVVVNLYPFIETAARPEASPAELVEEIDIGGPTLLRAAAKNFAAVGVVTCPRDYPRVIEQLKEHGKFTLEFRRELASKAFAATAGYDAAIASTFAELVVEEGRLGRQAKAFPARLCLVSSKASELRYGENPHQRAALYLLPHGRGGVARGRVLQGKELSYNNLVDLDAAWELAQEFSEPVAVIIKHTNPCGVALGRTQAAAYERAHACDPVSAFGSVLGFNQPLDRPTAEAIRQQFVEAVAAPGYEPAAREVLAGKRNLRLVEVEPASDDVWRWRSLSGGMLLQEMDRGEPDSRQLRVVTERAPTAQELDELLFAWRVSKHVKSNAIVYARDHQTVGVGAGQMSRVDAVKWGAQKAVLPLAGSVLASDAFFPFPDGVEEAARVGVTAVIQPGGSVRDAEVIAAANRLQLAMVCTGIRHFRH
jgi:phosphoribosylaminoimidazolecarboxamide formyltransferase/IMP cyclohydrolase